MFQSDATSDAARVACAAAPLSLSDLVQRIERRLAWYGLPRSSVRSLEIQDADSVVATVTVSGNGTFREEFDRRTGWVRRRDVLAKAA